jgi:hypothetical protein
MQDDGIFPEKKSGPISVCVPNYGNEIHKKEKYLLMYIISFNYHELSYE